MNDVKTKLITSRRIIFTPSTDLKEELANTAIQITCYDRDGKEVKRVTSTDDGTVEDPENATPHSDQGSENENGENGGSTENGGGSNGGNTGSLTPTGGDNGGNTGGGDDNGERKGGEL